MGPKSFTPDLRRFVDSAPWAFAKSYAETWPHHYIVRQEVDGKLFAQLVEHIRRYGYEGRFYSKRMTYFEEAGLVYWTMGAPVDKTIIINRCPKENTYEYRLKHGTLPGK